MTTPKSFKKSNKRGRIIRVCKKSIASEAIGKLQKNTDTFILTFGQFSLIDTLTSILDQTGPAHVTISTWTAANADLERSASLMASSEILSLRMIVDIFFKTRQPKYFYHMINLFGSNSIRQMKTHAKFIIVQNDQWNIVVRTSMNLNKNPRLENIEISENKDFTDFFNKIVDEIFNEIKPNEVKKSILDLKNTEEQSLFKEVSANFIKRSSLNEPRFSHEIKEK
ncbi:MAG: hypothetical protein HOJ48_05870 [Desulfobacula sp.]|jgi:hypothetical protein|nr:hypothetical protein [Desulfobacula sp.]